MSKIQIILFLTFYPKAEVLDLWLLTHIQLSNVFAMAPYETQITSLCDD